MKKTLLFLIIGGGIMSASAQHNVGIGTVTPDPSAVLELNSNNSGFLTPRMTTIQRTGIVSPATGLVVYDTNIGCFFFYNGTVWTSLCTPAAPGPTGPTGPDGVAGPAGANGTNGINGTNGLNGPTGPAGTNGIDGNTGPAGANGTNGVNGATGPTGPIGADGATGPAGINGTNGTNGATGPAGSNGINGTNGTNGINGSTGPTGPAGANGTTGPTGAGATGPTGPAGTNGAAGATGPAGANGAAGPTGSAGANGANGAAGATGPAGSNGAAGATGPAGSNGTAGATGPTGPGTICNTATANMVTRFTNATTMCNSDIYDDLTNIGIFTTAPTSYMHFIKNGTNTNFDILVDETGTGNAGMRVQTTPGGNGTRTFLGVTNYNASAFAAAAVMGLSLNTNGSGAAGVQGTANGSAQIGVLAQNQNALALTTGWALYANNRAGGVQGWQNVSDRRLKKDIATIPGSLDIVKKLRGVNYLFDKDKYPDINLPDGIQWGFVAQEVEEVMPNVVSESVIPGGGNKKADTGIKSEQNYYNFKTLSYTNVIPVLVEAIKEQQKQIEELRGLLGLKNK